MESREELICSNLLDLANCTLVGSEFLNCLLSKRLLSISEYQILGAGPTDYDKATTLYTRFASKWNDNQFNEFVKVLEKTGNTKAHDIFTSGLSKQDLDVLKLHFNNWNHAMDWSYEGMSFEDEGIANTVHGYLRDGKLFLDEEFIFQKKGDELISLLQRFLTCLKDFRVWTNPKKPKLPKNFVDRRVHVKSQQPKTLEALAVQDEKVISISDDPGVRKSSTVTRLEMLLREKVASNRIIMRVNLNEFTSTLNYITKEGFKSQTDFISKFANYIPLDLIRNSPSKIPMYILLDGLDEVLPTYEDSMKVLLQTLQMDEQNVQKLVLTTRPHLKKLAKKSLNVKAYKHDPLSPKEQVEYLMKELGGDETATKDRLKNLPESVHDLLGNPLMLSLYTQISSNNSEILDIYSLYTNFVEKKHEIYVYEKEMGDPYGQATNRRKKEMLEVNLCYYNFVALEDLLRTDELNLALSVSESYSGQKIIYKPTSDKIEDLVSFGMVLKNDNRALFKEGGFVFRDSRNLRFKHRSFAEYFYVKMMTDIKNVPKDLRNALFAVGYQEKNNISVLISCLLNQDFTISKFVTKGWTQFVPKKAKLSRYISSNSESMFKEYLLYNTLNYENECVMRNSLLIQDLYGDKIFLNWLISKIRKESSIQEIMFHESMTEVLALMAVSNEKDILCVMNQSLAQGGNEDKIKQAVKKSNDLIQLGVKWKYLQKPREICTLNLHERMRKWLTAENVKQSAIKCLGTDADFDRLIIQNVELGRFFASVLSKEELINLVSNEETRVTDAIGLELDQLKRCWGEEYWPPNLLKFRRKFGSEVGTSLFLHSSNRTCTIRLWDEIEENVNDAVQIISDDGDYYLLRILEISVGNSEAGLTGCISRSCTQTFSDIYDTSKRRFLTKTILDCIDWNHLAEVASPALYNIWCHFLACGSLKSLEEWKEFLPKAQFQFMNAYKCLLWSALKDEIVSNPGRVQAPFHLVVEWFTQGSWKDYNPLAEILRRTSKEELANAAKMKRKDPELLIDLPTVWEVFFMPQVGLAHKQENRDLLMEQMTENGWRQVITDILFFANNVPCCLLYDVLDGLRQINSSQFKRLLLSSFVTIYPSNIGSENRDRVKCFLKGLGRIHIEIFGNDFSAIWVQYSSKTAPVELLCVAEDNGWDELHERVKSNIRQRFTDVTFKKIQDSIELTYFQEKDWYCFLKVFPELQNKASVYFAANDNIYKNWECCLLRVWIRMFGPEKTRKDANYTFWKSASENMMDGELLQIAIEVGSMEGVKLTSWPGMLNWNGKTALQISKDKWGEDNEITRFLMGYDSK